MKISLHKPLIPLTLLAAVALLIAGCGGGDDTTTATTGDQTAANGGGTVTIKMGDYYFAPKNVTIPAGPTTFETPNEGSAVHELVIFKTNMDPANLPTDSEGNVNEEALERGNSRQVGEIEDVEPGETKSATFALFPGKYVMVCNIPGHYAKGMYGSITVTE